MKAIDRRRCGWLVLGMGVSIGAARAIGVGRSKEERRSRQDPSIPWPDLFEGDPLQPVELTEREEYFLRQFPGSLARFVCGEREVILRQVNRASRKLHPSTHCFRASGFSVGKPERRRHNQTGFWLSYRISKEGKSYQVREQVYSVDGVQNWAEVESWYWDAFWDRAGEGPWRAVTVIEEEG